MATPVSQAPLLINGLPPQLLELGKAFSVTIPSYTFIDKGEALTISASLSDGSPLPDWLQFDAASRTLRGTPPLAGQLSVRFTATTAGGQSTIDTIALSITSGKASLLFNQSYGYGHAITVVGSRAYLATGHRGLAIYDISQPQQPSLLGTYDSPGYARDVAIHGNDAYLADSNSGLLIIDISNPNQPGLKQTLSQVGNANAVTLSGSYAYVAAWDQGLKIIDVSTSGQPQLIGSLETPGTAVNVTVSGNYAYVADYQGIAIINISTPSAPSLIRTYYTTSPTYAITVAGSLAFVVCSTGLEILSLSDPELPSQLGFYNFPAPEDTYWIKEPTIAGNKLYLSTMNSGVHVLDISNPSSPQLLAIYPTDEATDLAITDANIFVADQYNLRVIDKIQTDATPARAEPILGVPLSGAIAYQGQPFSYQIPAQTFVDPGDILSYSASLGDGSPLPSWLSFDPANRRLSGTPTASGSINLRIKAIDQSGLEAGPPKSPSR